MKAITSIGAITINSSYTHTSPTIRILRNIAREAGFGNAWCKEFTLKDPLWRMADEILGQAPDVLAFSVYIWNRARSIELAKFIKAARPEVRIAFGGPELVEDPTPPPGCDEILTGDAEVSWRNFVIGLAGEKIPRQTISPYPSPYLLEDDASLKGRMIYVETTRGCPYKCAFCCSASGGSVHVLVEDEKRAAFIEQLSNLSKLGIKTVKFLDRTFNANPARALAWWQDLAKLGGGPYHFEVRLELIDDSTLAFLKTIPPGLFQFEVGLQSLSLDTLRQVKRSAELGKTLQKLKALNELKNIKIHADLIWGLPGENLSSILHGFDQLVLLQPQELQLGFLKLLPGTPLRAHAAELGIIFQSEPPYMVVRHPDLSADELLYLHRLEHVFNLFYNSGRFKNSLRFLLSLENNTPTALFDRLAKKFMAQDLFKCGLGLDRQYELFLETFAGPAQLTDYLRLDYLTAQRTNHMPAFLVATSLPL